MYSIAPLGAGGFLVEKKLPLSNAREKLSDLLDQVQYRGDTYIISRHGKPAAAIVPIELYENWKRERKSFFDFIRQSQRQVDLPEGEAEQIALDAVRMARQAGRDNE